MLILSALHCEASPIIDALKLKRDHDSSPFEVYRNDAHYLILSGMGKLRAAIAATFALNSFTSLENLLAINVGVCGAKPTFPVGKVFLPNKILDHATGRVYFPDILLRHKFIEASLVTVDKPVLSANVDTHDSDLFEMEASGFFEAGNCFLQSSQMLAFKVTSDHGVDTPLKKEDVTRLIGDNVAAILDYALEVDNLIKQRPSPLSETDKNILSELGKRLRLSRYQTNSLNRLALSYKIRTQGNLEILSSYFEIQPQEKHEANSTFDKIRNVLSA